MRSHTDQVVGRDSLSRLAKDFANGPKWRDPDTDREYESHMSEYASDRTPKNLVDAAIIKSIKAAIARKRAMELLREYNRATGQDYRDIMPTRLSRFRDYQYVPFPG